MKTISPKALILTVLIFTPLLQAQTTTPQPNPLSPSINSSRSPTFHSTILESGLWWSPQDSGTSYSITTQNNVLFMVVNTYDQSGNPTWFTGSTQIPAYSKEPDGSNILAIDLLESTGGSCLGCPHQAPKTSNSQMQIFLSFSDRGHGQLTINGKQMNIVPFNFYGTGVARLAGTWGINYFSPSVSIGRLNQIGTIICSTTLDSSSSSLFGLSLLADSYFVSLIQQTADPDMYLIITQEGSLPAQFRVGIYMLSGLNYLIGIYGLANDSDDIQSFVDHLASEFNPREESMGIRINNI